MSGDQRLHFTHQEERRFSFEAEERRFMCRVKVHIEDLSEIFISNELDGVSTYLQAIPSLLLDMLNR